MDIKPYSVEAQEVEALAARLEEGDLTLDAIRGIEDEMLCRPVDEKTRKIGQEIFSRIEQKRRGLVDKAVVLLDGKNDLGSKIKRLNLWNGDLSPDELEEEALTLFRELPLEEDACAQKMALQQLEEIRFEIAQPIAHELVDGALCSNFASRLRLVAERMLEQNSLTPFQGLNETQKREIYRYAGVVA